MGGAPFGGKYGDGNMGTDRKFPHVSLRNQKLQETLRLSPIFPDFLRFYIFQLEVRVLFSDHNFEVPQGRRCSACADFVERINHSCEWGWEHKKQ